LKRVIQRAPQIPIASLIIKGRIGEGDLVPISLGDEGLIVNGEMIEAAAM
jgi:ATP-dependent Clp protease ATP-binding subunit ClpB